jgi:uncharacterized protein
LPRVTSGDGRPRKLLRRLVVTLTVLVVLAVALFGAAAWYFAGQINSDGLVADHTADPRRYGLVVDDFSGGRVVLRATGDGDARLESDYEYGLVWPDGAGVLTGAPTPQDGGGVRRALRVTTGTPPTVGTKADLDTGVWADPTAAYGVPYDEVSFPCAGGTCPAWYVPGESSTWLVMVHGKGGSRTEALRALGAGLREHLPALLITYRNDPEAPADPSGRYGYGATEWHDLEAAVGYATEHGARHVVLFGSSMGGAIVAAFLEHSRSASLVSGVVLDAPALDFGAAVTEGAAHRTLPVLGTPIPDGLTATAQWVAGWRYGVDWAAIDYLRGDWLHVPALVFHGTADGTVPVATSDEFRRTFPHLVTEVRVPGAGHVEAWNADPAAYTGRVSAFLRCLTAASSAGCGPAA